MNFAVGLLLFVLITTMNCCNCLVFSRCSLVRVLESQDFEKKLLPDWVCLVENESARNTSALGGPNKNGSFDYGLFQINSGYWCGVGEKGGDCHMDCKLPVSVVSAPDNTVEEPEELILEDDSTTHNLERLVSAATCLVAGVEYTHGQQIYRADQCEFCLCLDGEMFCWWQDCPPVAEGPCKDRRPFSPCANGLRNNLEHPNSLAKFPTTRSNFPSTYFKSTTEQSPTTDLEETWSTVDNITSAVTEEEQSTEGETTTMASVCIVMGTSYKIGEMLPHATGNCLECTCGPGAKVVCSPHLCAPPGDDSVDYRPPGPF